MLWLIRFTSDLTTKSPNTRRRFQGRLAKNLKDALDAHGIAYRLTAHWSRLFLEADDPQVPEVLARVFGIHSFSPVNKYPLSTLEDLVAQGHALYAQAVKGKTYAVRARRSGQASFSSMDVQQQLGAALNEGATVNLSDPQITVSVEVRDGQVYFFSDSIEGPGGLPLAVEGRALALMSGGFDSAVAAWMMLKRGLALDYVFFRLGGAAHERDVHQVLEVLGRHWSYGTQPRLFVIPFEQVVAQIQDHVRTSFWQMVLKRQMLRAAQAVAGSLNLHTLITGEALGQVSSQTLTNLEALNITDKTLVLRPLIGFDKNDIVKLAYRIGTGELSAKVPEYCAIVPQRPVTAAKFRDLDQQEAQLPQSAEVLPESAKRIQLRKQTLSAPQWEVVGEFSDANDAVLLDIRSAAEFRRQHDPRALHFEFAYALDMFATLDKRKTYYVYCNVGLKSASLVERMKQSGYKAFVYHPQGEAV